MSGVGIEVGVAVARPPTVAVPSMVGVVVSSGEGVESPSPQADKIVARAKVARTKNNNGLTTLLTSPFSPWNHPLEELPSNELQPKVYYML